MEIKTKKQVTQEITKGFVCDTCEKEIKTEDLPNDWHEFEVYESFYEHNETTAYHVCSPECYISIMTYGVILNENYECTICSDMGDEFARKFREYLRNKDCLGE